MFFFLYSLNAALPGLKSKISVSVLYTRIRQSYDCQYNSSVGNIDIKKYIYVNKLLSVGKSGCHRRSPLKLSESLYKCECVVERYTRYTCSLSKLLAVILLLCRAEKQLRVKPFLSNFNFSLNLSGLINGELF